MRAKTVSAALRALGLQYRVGVCTPGVYMYTCTINGGELSVVDIVYEWKVKGETIHLHLIINPKSTCSCSAIRLRLRPLL